MLVPMDWPTSYTRRAQLVPFQKEREHRGTLNRLMERVSIIGEGWKERKRDDLQFEQCT